MPQAIRSKINPHYPHIKSQYYVDASLKKYTRICVVQFFVSWLLVPCCLATMAKLGKQVCAKAPQWCTFVEQSFTWKSYFNAQNFSISSHNMSQPFRCFIIHNSQAFPHSSLTLPSPDLKIAHQFPFGGPSRHAFPRRRWLLQPSKSHIHLAPASCTKRSRNGLNDRNW